MPDDEAREQIARALYLASHTLVFPNPDTVEGWRGARVDAFLALCPAVAEALGAVERVRAEHVASAPIATGHYAKVVCRSDGQTWPCRTTRALDGEP